MTQTRPNSSQDLKTSCGATSLDLEALEKELSNCSERSKLYLTVKRVVQIRGRWKAKPRGKPNPEHWYGKDNANVY